MTKEVVLISRANTCTGWLSTRGQVVWGIRENAKLTFEAERLSALHTKLCPLFLSIWSADNLSASNVSLAFSLIPQTTCPLVDSHPVQVFALLMRTTSLVIKTLPLTAQFVPHLGLCNHGEVHFWWIMAGNGHSIMKSHGTSDIQTPATNTPTLTILVDTDSVLINLIQRIQPPRPYSTFHVKKCRLNSCKDGFHKAGSLTPQKLLIHILKWSGPNKHNI
jgi:hypothetical protein